MLLLCSGNDRLTSAFTQLPSITLLHPGAHTLIVEPHFRSHFEVPRASASYRAFVGSLPELLVVEAQEMQPLVSSVSARMAFEIRSMVSPGHGGIIFVRVFHLS